MAMANLIVAAAPQRDVGIATGMNAVMRTIGMALGSALWAAILAGATAPRAAFASEHGYASPSPWRPRNGGRRRMRRRSAAARRPRGRV